MKKTLIAFAVALVAFFAVPLSAQGYGSTSPTTTGTIGTGQQVTVSWPAGTFINNEDLTAASSSTSGTATLAPTTTRPATFLAVSSVYFANSDGSFSIYVTLPTTPGTTTVTVTGGTSSATATAVLTTTAADLPHTGANVGPYLWVGAGVIALGLALVVVFNTRRKALNKN